MKLRSGWMLGAAGAAVLFFGTAAVFVACHRGMGPCSIHSRFNGHPTPDRILEMLDRKTADLELSGSQKAVYERIRSSVREDLQRFEEGRTAFREDIRKEMAARKPDVRAAAGRIKEGMDELHTLMAGHLDRMVELYEILDDVQKQQVLDHVRERMDRCGS